MKCFLFIITLFSVGRFIDTHREDYADSNFSGTEVTSDKPSEESEESTDDDSSDENPSIKEIRHIKNVIYNISYIKVRYKNNFDNSSDTKNDTLPEDAAGLDIHVYISIPDIEDIKMIAQEMLAGDQADLFGHNQHVRQSNYYTDLGRRSAAQDLKNIAAAAENADYLTPEKAPPELVLLVAKESALLRTGTDQENEFDRKKLLRSGDYWNGVWKEEVKPKSAMRSASQKKKLGSIKARIKPGTELYKLVSRMKKISPQLLYIINKKQP